MFKARLYRCKETQFTLIPLGRISIFITILFVFHLLTTAVSAATITIDVSPANPNGWVFWQETTIGSGSFVNGPDIPPVGRGSAQLQIDSTGGEMLFAGIHGGTYLRDITALSYQTYHQSGSTGLTPALQFNIDYDLDDSDTSWQGRLVYEPIYSGISPSTGIWEQWNPLDSNAKWWASGEPGKSLCPQGPSCTWTQILTQFPNAGIHATSPGILFKVGSGWTGGFVGNVDDFTIQINNDTTQYNFENTSCQNITLGSDHNTIQDAIDNANTNDVIQCAAGIYTENITVNKAVALIGASSNCSDGSLNTIIQKATNTPLVTLTASGTAVNPILFQDMCIHPEGVFGIDIPDTGITISHITLNNIQVVGTNETNDSENERGFMVGETSSLTDLIVNDSAFDHLTYGWYFKKRVSTSDLSTVEQVTVTNTSFSHNDAKGIYAEKLSDASFTGGIVHNNGLNLGFFNKSWHAGFDINLKAGTYQNMTFDGISFTQNGLGTQHGVALMLKARDDGTTYGSAPATLTNVLIQNNTISGNERGVRLGEVGKSNATPTNVSIISNKLHNNNPIYTNANGSVPGAIVLITNGTVVVKGNEFDGNSQVFSQLMGSLTAYANTIKNFTDAGLETASGTTNGRHNWWDTYTTKLTGVDDDSWAFRLGAPIISWADGTGSASLLDSNGGTASLEETVLGVGGGTAVLVNHNRPSTPADAPFGKAIAADIGANQCSDFYDAFVIDGVDGSNYDLSIPVNAVCTDTLIGDNLFQFDLVAIIGVPNADACTPATACWNLISADRTGDVLTATVNEAALRGTPFVAPSMNNNDPTAVSLSTFSATINNMGRITAVILLLLTLATFILWKRHTN